MDDLNFIPISEIPEKPVFSNATLGRLNEEADVILAFMSQKADLQDPASLIHRLNDMDAYLARLSSMVSTAKAMREYAKTRISQDNADVLLNLKKTVSDRIIASYLYELTISCERFETLYNTLLRQSNDLQSQISYIRNQMRHNI